MNILPGEAFGHIEQTLANNVWFSLTFLIVFGNAHFSTICVRELRMHPVANKFAVCAVKGYRRRYNCCVNICNAKQG